MADENNDGFDDETGEPVSTGGGESTVDVDELLPPEIAALLHGEGDYGADPFDVFYSTVAGSDQEIFTGSETETVNVGGYELTSNREAAERDAYQERLLFEARNRFGTGFFSAPRVGGPGVNSRRDRNLDRFVFPDQQGPSINAGNRGAPGDIPDLSNPELFNVLEREGLLTPAQRERSRDTFSTVGELVQDFYSMDETELARIQRVMYVGGFYGSSMRFNDIPFGKPDEASYQAWVTAVTRTARLNAAGKKLTVDDVLGEAARTAGIGVDGGFKDRAGVDVVVSLSDPAALRQNADRIAQNVLGREATAEEERLIVAVTHGMQRQAQTVAQLAGRDGDGGAVGGTDGAEGLEITETTTAERRGLSERRFRGGSSAGEQFAGERRVDVVQDPGVAADIAEATSVDGSITGDTITEVTQPSPDAQAERTLREQNPGEAHAMDLLGVLSNLAEKLSGGR